MIKLLQQADIWFLTAGVVLMVCTFVQLFYYTIFSKLVFYRKKNSNPAREPVSVVICAKNESDNLMKYLPGILTQEYPDFEVVVVNDCSEDDTETVLENLQKEYPNLRTTFIKKDEKFTHGKKLALNVGIKAAKNDLLLLTDADCFAETGRWIESVMDNFNSNVNIVLGYGGYVKKPGLLNKLIRFDTVFIAMQYMSLALSGVPYMGVGRNLAYRKSFYFKNKGFASHSHLKSGDDDLFVNETAGKNNTKIEIGKDSFTRSTPEPTMEDWFFQKKRHMTTGVFYKSFHKFVLVMEPLSRAFFYASLVTCFFHQPFLYFALGIYGFRLVVQYVVFLFLTMRLKEIDLLLFLPLFDIMMLFINLNIAVSNFFNKRARYQWTK